MHDLGGAGRGEHRGESGEIRERKRIYAHRLVGRGELQQAQLRTVGALAQELGVEAYARLSSQASRKRGRLGRGGDDGVQNGP